MPSPCLRLAWLILVLVPTVSRGTITFERIWHWSQADAGRSVVLAGDGGYAVGAGAWIGGTNYGATLAWIDSLGDTVNVRRVFGLDNGAGYICRTDDGGYAVVGTRDTLGVFARKYGPTGDSIWTYSSASRGPVFAIIGTTDSGCLVVGQIPDTMSHFGLIKLRADGSEDWSRYYVDPRVFGSVARGAAQTSDGGFVICGYAHDYMDSYPRLVRTDSAGQEAWNHLYAGAVGPVLNDVVETPDRGFLAVGYELDTLGWQNALYLVRTDSLGSVIWTRNLALPGAATSAAAVSATRDSGYIAAGSIEWIDSSRVWLVKFDAGVDTQWTRVLGHKGREAANDVRQTPDGGYVIAGTSDSAGGSVLLVKTDSLGGVSTGLSGGTPAVRRRAALWVAPNPSSGVVRVSYSLPGTAGATMEIYDVAGHLVHSSFGLRAPPLRLDLRSMPAGVYLLRIDYGGDTATRKLVVE